MEFQDYFQAWQTATQEFLAAVNSIPEESQRMAGVCGIWSSKELLAHLAGWNREALRRYKDYLNGDQTNTEYDTDAFNAQSVEALKLFNWRETLDTYQQTVTDLTRLIQSLTPEQIATERRYRVWLRGLTNDLHEHTHQVRDWLAGKNHAA